MFRLMVLLAGLGGLLASVPGSQNSFMDIIIPTKIQGETSDNSEVEKEQVSYIIPIDEELYTVHLKRRYFLADNFRVYLQNQGSMSSHSSDIMTRCYYQGYIEGYPNSVVTLNTCFGLRGILQFENVSFAIEPLDSAIDFQHVIYKLGNRNKELGDFNKNNRRTEKHPVVYNIVASEKKTELPLDLFPLYLEIHIVVDKALYDYLGSENTLVTNKIFEIISLVNSAFSQLKVTIVLTSLELWSDKNKISTVGQADELLNRFLEWKQSYLTLRPHDAAYLFIYRDYSNYVGATFPGKMCITPYSAGIILYPKGLTLEGFSVIFAQMLGLSLGIPYDDPTKCQCSEVICAMNLEAIMHSSGVKTFSNCSLRAFKKFIENMGAKCLQNKPQMQKSPRPVCGNGKVEGNEACDCGSAEQCGPASCCDPASCVLKQGSQCDTGPCCANCQLSAAGTTCRPIVHPECDVPEFCNGSSASCPPDIFIQNGQTCKNEKFFCYEGDCHDLDEKCEVWFGKGSRNAPFACYEEIQSQTDRFGNCGIEKNKKFKFCGWRNLICGRLICTYPFRTPYHRDNASVIYAFVRESVCISVDTGDALRDPFAVRSGAHCDTERICVDRTCVESRMIKENAKTCAQRCSGHGVCNSQGVCNCSDGYQPPDCQARSRRAFVTAKKGSVMDKASGNAIKSWLLTFYIVSAILIIVSIIVLVRNRLKEWFAKEEEFLSNEFKSGGSTHSYLSRSRTESSSQIDTSKSASEDSTQAYSSSDQ